MVRRSGFNGASSPLPKLLSVVRGITTTCRGGSSGVNVLALSRVLGHTSAKVTLDTYADLFDSDFDAVASALDSKCAHSVPKPRPVGPIGA
jgi:hypothetical protein